MTNRTQDPRLDRGISKGFLLFLMFLMIAIVALMNILGVTLAESVIVLVALAFIAALWIPNGTNVGDGHLTMMGNAFLDACTRFANDALYGGAIKSGHVLATNGINATTSRGVRNTGR